MSDVTHTAAGGSDLTQSHRPSLVRLREFGQLAARIGKRFGEIRLPLIAAGIAFFGLLALFPALSALVALGGFFLSTEDISAQIEPLLSALPPSASAILEGQLRAVAGTSDGSLSWALGLGLALALYSASRGTLTLMDGLNAARAEREDRGFFTVQATGLAITFAGLVSFVMTLALVAGLPAIASVFPEGSLTAQLILIARWPLLVALAIFGFAALYRFGPSRPPKRWAWITPGAVFAVVLWLGATVGFSWYVQTFGTYAETFGALAGVVVLMLWLFLSSFALLFGALLDAELEVQLAPDGTDA
ncbi:MAG: YihY/virulence factor BrkB family protein [Pseudomonadota bacterium]